MEIGEIGKNFISVVYTNITAGAVSAISVFILNSIMCVTSFFLVPMTFMTSKGPEGVFDTFPWLMLRHVEENGLDPSTMIAVSTLGFILMIFLTPIILVTKAVTDKITPDVSF